jgi:hypothetical protein
MEKCLNAEEGKVAFEEPIIPLHIYQHISRKLSLQIV